MPLEKTFFSYSRDDSEFVLKLAKDLRAAGADIWLDQLDIPAGKRWDAEIETALENSQGQLVILSPSSVDSHNVMDEVSYALEKGKQVIPIILKECQIPFRLKRLQYIDFTSSFDAGFNQLLKALNLEQTKESESVQSVSGKEEVIKSNEEKSYVEEERKQKVEREAEQKRNEQIKQDKILKERKLEEERTKHSKDEITSGDNSTIKKGPVKWVIAVSLLIVVIVVAILIINNGDPVADEENAWRIADSTYTIYAYEAYLKNYPEGKYSADARESIAELEHIIENYATIAKPEDMVMCEEIQDMDPIGITNDFFAGRVYVWANVRAPTSEDVIFDWIDDYNNLIASTTIYVNEDLSGYRIYAYQTINEAGIYEVRLYNSKDYLIGSQTFTIK